MLAFPSVAPVRWGFVNWQSQPYGRIFDKEP